MLLHYRDIVDGCEEGGTLLLILLKREDEPVHQSEIAEERGETVYASLPVGYGYEGFAVDDGEDTTVEGVRDDETCLGKGLQPGLNGNHIHWLAILVDRW